MKNFAQEYKFAQDFISKGDLEGLGKLFIENPSSFTENANAYQNLLDFALESKQIPSIIFLINQKFITRNTPLLSTILLSSPLYLYSDKQGNFQFSTSVSGDEQKGSYFSQINVLADSELALKLMDKYLYKSIRHRKYERDIELGKIDPHTMQAYNRSSRNLVLLKTCLAILYPVCPLANGMSCTFYELSLSNISEYLIKKEQESRRHYGDSLSDDSDSDDNIENCSHTQTPKKKSFQQREKLSGSDLFKKKTRQQTPRNSPKGIYAHHNAGLEGKLSVVVTRVQEQKITTEATVIIHLEEIIKDLKEKGPTTSPERAEDGKKLAGLRERARIPASEAEKEVIKKINSKIDAIANKNGYISSEEVTQIIKQSEIKLFVAQYRGINYMIDRWNAESRRYHRTMDEVNDKKEDKEEKETKYSDTFPGLNGLPQYSEMVLKTLPYCFYTELEAKNDFTKIPQYKAALESIARNIGNFLYRLEYTGPCFDYTNVKKTKRYYFNNVGDRFQHQFSNGIDSHLNQLQGLRSLPDDKYWQSALPSAHNPSIATGNIPYHALKYSYGLKDYYPHPLRPRYGHRTRTDGVLELYAEYMHVGKCYVSLHEITEVLDEQRVKRVSHLDRQGQVAIRRNIANEKETSFLSFTPKGKIFYQFVIKFPSFKGSYKSIHQVKYGLSRPLYESFQYLLLRSNPHTQLRDKVIELLSEWLCSYHEVLLLEIASERARKLNSILVYLTHDNKLSFLPDKNLFTPRDKNALVRLETHIRRVLRRTIADNHSLKLGGGIPFHGFTLETGQWVESQLQEILKNPYLLINIAGKSASEAKQSHTQEITELTRRIVESELVALHQSASQILSPDQLGSKDKIDQLQNLLKQLSLEEPSSAPSVVKPSSTSFQAILPPPSVFRTFINLEQKLQRFLEVEAKPNGNCLFESSYNGLLALRPAALATREINSFSSLREYIANILIELKDQKTTTGQTFRQLVIDQIADVILGRVDTTGYPQHLRAWLEDCAHQYKNHHGDGAALNNFLNENAFPAYIDAISQDHTWGGIIEMQVISYLFKVKIVVYNEVKQTPISILGQNFQSTLNLYHRDGGTHYHWLKSIPTTGQWSGLFPSAAVRGNRQQQLAKDDSYVPSRQSVNYI